MRWTPTIAIVIALTGALGAASGTEDRLVIDPDVRAAARGGTIRVVVELRAPHNDPSALRRHRFSRSRSMLRRSPGSRRCPSS
jgi:hypothetical protein